MTHRTPDRALFVEKGVVQVIDQRWLPHKVVVEPLTDLAGVATAIRDMHVRGAPLIGATAAYGMAIAARAGVDLDEAARLLLATRPTAVDLRFGVEAMLRAKGAWSAADQIAEDYVAMCRRIGEHGADVLPHTQGAETLNILTHCNAGWLATIARGTATAPIYEAHERGMGLHVWVDETRPRNQGALTAWELEQAGVPHKLVADNAGGHLMQNGDVDVVIVGADRIATNGDAANKIGTYLKALAAHDNGVPFYVAAPSTTIDAKLATGGKIVIEERDEDEVTTVLGLDEKGALTRVRTQGAGTRASNPGFDVTPARLITGIITERGVCAPGDLRRLFPELPRV